MIDNQAGELYRQAALAKQTSKTNELLDQFFKRIDPLLIYIVAKAKAIPQSDKDDAVQHVRMRIYNSLINYDPSRNPSAFIQVVLNQSVRSCCTMNFRQAGRHSKQTEAVLVPESTLVASDPENEDATNHFLDALSHGRTQSSGKHTVDNTNLKMAFVRQCVKHLSKQEQLVLNCIANRIAVNSSCNSGSHYKYEDVAKELGLSLKQVDNAWSRIKRKIRRLHETDPDLESIGRRFKKKPRAYRLRDGERYKEIKKRREKAMIAYLENENLQYPKSLRDLAVSLGVTHNRLAADLYFLRMHGLLSKERKRRVDSD